MDGFNKYTYSVPVLIYMGGRDSEHPNDNDVKAISTTDVYRIFKMWLGQWCGAESA